VGGVWYPKPHVTASLARNDGILEIDGIFKYKSCSRFDHSGNGFPHLSCSMYSRIRIENDFRKQVVREDLSNEKRGTRSTRARS